MFDDGASALTEPRATHVCWNLVTDKKCFVLQVINGAGHHVYLDKPELFNKYVLEACVRADENPRTIEKKLEDPTEVESGDGVVSTLPKDPGPNQTTAS